jgi:hypothetical protein
MIGVVANDAEIPAIEEFFELFKTPWERLRGNRLYEVVIASDHRVPEPRAKLVLVYGTEETTADRDHGLQVTRRRRNGMLLGREMRIPIYQGCAAVQGPGRVVLTDEATAQPIAVESKAGEGKRIRLGYNLFQEIRHLLTEGQPASHAQIPALEAHIDLLRRFLVGASARFLEVPPVPAGYKFIVCLTHDMDHLSLRSHLGRPAMLGFLYRATLGSFLDFCAGRRPLRQLIRNWGAVLKLPLVLLGLASDFWCSFDHYLQIEQGAGSTFFLVPTKNEPGQSPDGRFIAKRAVHYDLEELAPQIRRLGSLGHEVALHGIDAWRDSAKGSQERGRICRFTGANPAGVRMHWLYFDQEAPAKLEQAGFEYDSTAGYNETVGYRAGTTQAFKPPGVRSLLELPLHIMDTALFFPSYRNLLPAQAAEVVGRLIDDVERFGGVLTVNWHDRSIEPERLWDGPYIDLVTKLKHRGAWFPTASRAVAWFRARRSVRFRSAGIGGDAFRIAASWDRDPQLPGMTVRFYNQAGQVNARGGAKPDCEYAEIPLAGEMILAMDSSPPVA